MKYVNLPRPIHPHRVDVMSYLITLIKTYVQLCKRQFIFSYFWSYTRIVCAFVSGYNYDYFSNQTLVKDIRYVCFRDVIILITHIRCPFIP